MGRGHGIQVRILTSTRACQVVPDITTFAVDDGFAYSIPSGLSVSVGSRVRIKVSGRRLKGFVTALFDAEEGRRLHPLEGLSSNVPSFDSRLLSTLRWASTHYVTPLSVILKRTLPPNRQSHDGANVPTSPGSEEPATITYHVDAAPHGDAVAAALAEVVKSGRNGVVIAPTVAEIETIVDELTRRMDVPVVAATSSMSGAKVTKAWNQITRGSGTILVGTREIMFWPFADLALVVVVEDGRRVMRSPKTPTTSVRDVILRRSSVENIDVMFIGPVPTLEVLNHGATVVTPDTRQWPIVEVVDRGDEPPTGSLLTEKTVATLRRAVSNNDRTFVLVGSRGYAPAFRCIACGEVRRCGNCGSAASQDDTCRRCGQELGACAQCEGQRFQALGAGVGRAVDDIGRIVGDVVGRPEDKKLVTVGSERDLIGVQDMGLAIAVDIDGLTMAPHYRAAEDALRLLVRLCQTVRRGDGSSCLVQTAMPKQPVLTCLTSGRSETFLAEELATRSSLGFPPVGSLIAIEIRGDTDATDVLTAGVGDKATLLGPADVGDRQRWLIQGRDLADARIALRPILTNLRNAGNTVRVDVDPIDL